MRIQKLLVGIFILSFVACNVSKNSDKATHPPEVIFDFSDMPKDVEIKPVNFVNDLEKVFSKEQNEEIEKRLNDLFENASKTIYILTVPSSEESEEDWEIETSFGGDDGLWITFSKSMKSISITPGGKAREVLTEEKIKKIIEGVIVPEFENENFYKGIEKGVLEILENWK